jgi:peptide deformylase
MTARNSTSRSTHHESTRHEVHSSGTFRVSVRRVLTRPDERLKVRASEVDPCDLNTVALADALIATMRTSPACVGLAATQVGEPVRIFCMDVTGHRKARSCAGLVVLCNPAIVSASDDVVMREGCMSVPEWTGNVARAKEVVVEGYEPGSGRVIRVSADEMEARCLQHEIDHLDGLVFVDRVNDAAVDLFPRKTYA